MRSGQNIFGVGHIEEPKKKMITQEKKIIRITDRFTAFKNIVRKRFEKVPKQI